MISSCVTMLTMLAVLVTSSGASSGASSGPLPLTPHERELSQLSIPGYLFNLTSGRNALRFVNLYMLMHRFRRPGRVICACEYKILGYPTMPIQTRDPPVYLRLDVPVALGWCRTWINYTMSHRVQDCNQVETMLRKVPGFLMYQPNRSSRDPLYFNGRMYEYVHRTGEVAEYLSPAGTPVPFKHRGRSDFIPTLEMLNKRIAKVFRWMISLSPPGEDYGGMVYWNVVKKMYRRSHWTPKSRMITAFSIPNHCVYQHRFTRPRPSPMLDIDQPAANFKVLMHPVPYRGFYNISEQPKLYEEGVVFRIGKMFLTGMDNKLSFNWAPYMGTKNPFPGCNMTMLPIDIGVTTCSANVIKHYLQWRIQPAFYTLYPTFVHFIRSCQQYAYRNQLGGYRASPTYATLLPIDTREFVRHDPGILYRSREWVKALMYDLARYRAIRRGETFPNLHTYARIHGITFRVLERTEVVMGPRRRRYEVA